MKKVIIIDDCLLCPFVGKCKPWRLLGKLQRFSLKCGTNVGKFILKDCPLPNIGSTEDIFNPKVI